MLRGQFQQNEKYSCHVVQLSRGTGSTNRSHGFQLFRVYNVCVLECCVFTINLSGKMQNTHPTELQFHVDSPILDFVVATCTAGSGDVLQKTFLPEWTLQHLLYHNGTRRQENHSLMPQVGLVASTVEIGIHSRFEISNQPIVTNITSRRLF